MTSLDKVMESFKANPTPENAWQVQIAMIDYQKAWHQSTTKASTKGGALVKFKTAKGKHWDDKLQEIIDLFVALGCTVREGKKNQYIQCWELTDKEGNKAGLYLGTEFTMGPLRVKDRPLAGRFESYDDRTNFVDFLACNDIHLEDND